MSPVPSSQRRERDTDAPRPARCHVVVTPRPQREPARGGFAACHVAVAEIAARQHGTVDTRQLLEAGLTRAAIRAAEASARLRRKHRGVFLVGASEPPLAAEAAAVLATGPGSVLSHRSAAAMWGLLDRDGTTVDVTTPTNRRTRDGIRIHRATLNRSDIRVRDNLPLTEPFRTLQDLATDPGLGAAAFESAVSEALIQRLVNEQQLSAIPRARRLLEAGSGSRNEAERLLGKLIARAGLERPQRNVHLHGYELDFYWPAHRLNLELDGFRTHGTALRFRRDRRRDLHLKAHGIDTLRATWWQLADEPERLVATLARATASAGPRAPRARA